MSSNVIAVYPGTFDPMTLGHEDVVRRATQLFSKVIVAVAAGHHKKALFTLQERIDMARDAVQPYSDQVTVESFSGLLRDFVVARGGKAMVRGLRAVTDFDYEFQLAGMNRSLMPEVETVFLTPSDKYQFISSTFVREIAMLGGEVDKFVSPQRAGQPDGQGAQPRPRMMRDAPLRLHAAGRRGPAVRAAGAGHAGAAAADLGPGGRSRCSGAASTKCCPA